MVSWWGLLTLDDLKAISEPVGALLLELPQRDLGGQLPGEAYHAKAKDVAALLASFSEIEIVPSPPHTNMMHLFIRGERDNLEAATLSLWEDLTSQGIENLDNLVNMLCCPKGFSDFT
jgi:hypothetical protein